MLIKNIVALTIVSSAIATAALGFSGVQAQTCHLNQNPDGSYTQVGCSKRGNDTFQVFAGNVITLQPHLQHIFFQITHADSIKVNGVNTQYFRDLMTQGTTFRVSIIGSGETQIPNGTKLFSVSYKAKVLDFANSELVCQPVY